MRLQSTLTSTRHSMANSSADPHAKPINTLASLEQEGLPGVLQLIFSQCIMPVPNFSYALWDFMQDQMCHIVWLLVTSAKNVTLPTWYRYLWERNYYQKKNWEKFVRLSCLNNTACTHLEVSVSSGPEAHAISSPQKFICYFLSLKSAILNKGLQKIYVNWMEKGWNIWLLYLRGIFVALRAY